MILDSDGIPLDSTVEYKGREYTKTLKGCASANHPAKWRSEGGAELPPEIAQEVWRKVNGQVEGWHKSETTGKIYPVTTAMLRTCPDCGSDNAYESPDPAQWGVFECWCGDRNEGDEYA